MRVFFALRKFMLEVKGEEETLLPLTPRVASVTTEDIVDTSKLSLYLCICILSLSLSLSLFLFLSLPLYR